MAGFPGPVYGLEVPPGEVLIPASMEFPASFRVTMAAVDPTEEPEADEEGKIPSIPRSTLRIVKSAYPGLEDEDEGIDEDELRAMLARSGEFDEDDDEDSDDEPNGGPSDPAKAKKQKQSASIKKLLQEAISDDDEDMEDAKPNGTKSGKAKGKAPASDDDDDEEDDSDDESDDDSLENFVVCTLDTERNYQQPLDITVGHGEKVFFVVTGTHTVYLTGNYIMDDDEDDEDSDDEEDYDLSPDEMDYGMGESEDESDELDDVENPRVTEVDSDDEEAPKLVEAKKGKNKRAAEDAAASLDDMIAQSDDSKLTKKQQKKLKNNKGEAVAAEEAKKDAKSDKKVQFAKNLEQGPTGSAEKAKQGKGTVGVKNVQGVTVDDRTIGNGRTVKNGDTVGVRYIGKLQNGKQFDANKKGKPFSFKVGKHEVIKGWDVGVVGMAIGGERRLTIPSNLAYGSKGVPGIPPNATLTFDVKLLEIK